MSTDLKIRACYAIKKNAQPFKIEILPRCSRNTT